MTARKNATNYPAPRLSTGPDDNPRAMCGTTRDQQVLDHVDDVRTPDPEHVEALKHMCAGCPLRPTCHTEHEGARWLIRVRGPIVKPTILKGNRPTWNARRDERLAALLHQIEQGATREEAAAYIGVSVTGLRDWCRRHGLMDSWADLCEGEAAA